MTQAKIAKRLKQSGRGAVISVRFDEDEFKKISKFAEAEGIPLAALIHDIVLNRVAEKEELAKLKKQWAEDARLRREQGIRLPSIWDVPNDDDMDEWLRE